MDYLGAVNTLRREKMINYGFDPCYWGIQIYDLFDQFFDLLETQQASIGTNSWYTLYEHKKHMQNKCRRFFNKGIIRYSDSLDEGMEEICKRAMVCISLHMKMQLKRGKNVNSERQALQRNLKILKEQELHTYTELCHQNGWYVERGEE